MPAAVEWRRMPSGNALARLTSRWGAEPWEIAPPPPPPCSRRGCPPLLCPHPHLHRPVQPGRARPRMTHEAWRRTPPAPTAGPRSPPPPPPHPLRRAGAGGGTVGAPGARDGRAPAVGRATACGPRGCGGRRGVAAPEDGGAGGVAWCSGPLRVCVGAAGGGGECRGGRGGGVARATALWGASGGGSYQPLATTAALWCVGWCRSVLLCPTRVCRGVPGRL